MIPASFASQLGRSLTFEIGMEWTNEWLDSLFVFDDDADRSESCVSDQRRNGERTQSSTTRTKGGNNTSLVLVIVCFKVNSPFILGKKKFCR